jgi:hypothetical protein
VCIRGDDLVEETNVSGVVVLRYAQGLNTEEPLAKFHVGATSYYESDVLG